MLDKQTFKLKKLFVTSNASRNIVKLAPSWRTSYYSKNHLMRAASKAGRGSTGRKLLWTKRSSPSARALPTLVKNIFPNSLFTIISIRHHPRTSNVYSLTAHATGLLLNQPQSSFRNVFSFLYTTCKSKILKFFFNAPYTALLFTLPSFTTISHLASRPQGHSTYVKSAGASAVILSKNSTQHTVLVRLPSGVRKIFSYYSLATLGSVSFKDKKDLQNTKSGFWRSKGANQTVRGVAMNPVDHPHGGRTKAIKYPRTPWGRTTKF